MSSHYCVGIIHKPGQHFWGSPMKGPPLVDPVPQKALELHPDLIFDWVNCEGCGEPLCGKPAPFRVSLCDLDGSNEQIFWLCAEHYDEALQPYSVNWHECHGGHDE
jgi:hypothetical protein